MPENGEGGIPGVLRRDESLASSYSSGPARLVGDLDGDPWARGRETEPTRRQPGSMSGCPASRRPRLGAPPRSSAWPMPSSAFTRLCGHSGGLRVDLPRSSMACSTRAARCWCRRFHGTRSDSHLPRTISVHRGTGCHPACRSANRVRRAFPHDPTKWTTIWAQSRGRCSLAPDARAAVTLWRPSRQ